MDVTQSAISMADHRGLWKEHPTRENQKIAEFTAQNGGLFWKECPALTTDVLVRWTKKDGQNGKKILATYDQRTEIKESHRQMKENQGLETLPSKKFVPVVF
jgi:hypothetical protein